MLRFSYETNPCNVLVDEGSEISAAKSTIAETDKSASIRPKPAATSSTSASQSSSSSTLSTTSQSTGGKRTLTSNRLNRLKRYRRDIIDLNVHHPSNDKSDSFQTSTTSTSSTSSTSTTTTPTNSIDFSLHASSTPFDINVPDSSSSISSSSPFTLSPLESNSNFVEFDNDGKIDEGESSDDGYVNGINGSSSVEEEFPMTNTTEDIDSMLLVGNVNEVSFNVVTHATNNELHLSETNFGDANSKLTTEFFDEVRSSPEYDDKRIHANVEKSDDDDTLQNDSPSLVSYGHDDINFVGLDKPIGADTIYQNADEQIEIHTLDKAKNERFDVDAANDVEQFPFIDTHNPDRIRYEVHDINSINRNDLAHETQSNKRILVNISIATDNGSGTENHAVYTLHVSVPAGPDFHPKTLDSDTNSDEGKSRQYAPILDTSHACPMEPPPVPPCLCNCDQFCRNVTGVDDDVRIVEQPIATTLSDSLDASDTDASTTNDAFVSSTTDETMTEEQGNSCLESKDIPTILILEGERESLFWLVLDQSKNNSNAV